MGSGSLRKEVMASPRVTKGVKDGLRLRKMRTDVRVRTVRRLRRTVMPRREA